MTLPALELKRFLKSARAMRQREVSWEEVYTSLLRQGYVRLPTYSTDPAALSRLLKGLCRQLTFDPARASAGDGLQAVDAGTDAVGLHIENGNTPLPPDIVAFQSVQSASRGAQTTLCDGVAVLKQLSPALRRRFSEPYTMTRYLPRVIWQRYVAEALKLDSAAQADRRALEYFMSQIPGQTFSDAEDDGIDYTLQIPAIRQDNLSARPAFANALLGPSWNYQAPTYRFSGGDVIDDSTLAELRSLGERYTREVAWADGDIVIIDNKRVMHGRRRIDVPLSERRLVIGMGLRIRAGFQTMYGTATADGPRGRYCQEFKA